MSEKIAVKKGEKYVLHSSCTYAGCEDNDTYIAQKDMTDEELYEEAREFMENTLSPEFWWEPVN